jgi:hypothetical protein
VAHAEQPPRGTRLVGRSGLGWSTWQLGGKTEELPRLAECVPKARVLPRGGDEIEQVTMLTGRRI